MTWSGCVSRFRSLDKVKYLFRTPHIFGEGESRTTVDLDTTVFDRILANLERDDGTNRGRDSVGRAGQKSTR